MSGSSPWRDPSSTRVAVSLAILMALANGVWLLLDHTVPSWDQSHYLNVTLEYQRSFENGGLGEFLRSVHNADPSHGPLFTLALLPFSWIFGASNSSGLLLNLCAAPVLYFCAGEIAWTIFRRWQARLLTILLVAATPILVGLYHNVLQDFLLVTLAVLSLLLLLKSEGFQRRGYTIAMGLAMALGTLNKVTFPLFVAGPLLVVAAQVLTTWISGRPELGGVTVDKRKLAWSLGLGLLAFLVVAFAWYGPNLQATIDYVRSTTGGPLAEGAGPEHPLTFHNITSFTLGVVNFNLGWVILLLGAVAVVLDWSRVAALFRRPLNWGPLWKLAFLLAWAVIPYLSVVTAHNQDVRLMAPAFPAVAILVAGAVSFVRPHAARYAIAGLAVFVLAYQTVTHVVDVTPSGLGNVALTSGEYQATVPLDREPLGYETTPHHDHVSAVLDYLEEVSEASPGGLEVPRTVCLLESEATMNSNTVGYLSSARGDLFGFADVVVGKGGEAELERILSGCNFALYVKPPPRPEGVETRVALVNEPYAANHMTPRLFKLFQGPSRAFETEPPAELANTQYLQSEEGPVVRVLTRTPGQGPIE